MLEKGISIVICCYNSARLIRETFKHLALQKFNDTLRWEIIVVNNNSSDDTENVVKAESEKWCPNGKVRLVSEPMAGLSYARKRGIHEAKYSLSIFCDDDNWLYPDYLQIAYNLMESNPNVGAAGGECIVSAKNILPFWWSQYANEYAVGTQESGSKDVSDRGYLWGAGLVVRTTLMQIIFSQKYPMLLNDRKGNELSSGGDSEICARILLMGYNLYYEEKMKLTHFMTQNRLTQEYRNKLIEGHKRAADILFQYQDVIKYSISPVENISIIYRIKKTFKNSLWFLHKYPPSKKVKDKVYTELNTLWNFRLIPLSPTRKQIINFRNFSVRRLKKLNKNLAEN